MFIHTFTTKSNKVASLRYPTIDDAKIMTEYINTLSKEDTFIVFSGETITYEEEEKFVRAKVNQIALGDCVLLLCFIDDQLVGISGVERHTESRKRGLHKGVFGISLIKECRSDGVGFQLATKVIEEAKKNINGLQIIKLIVYEPNTIAFEMYKKLGFKEYGRLPGGVQYKGQLYDEIEMYLSL